MSDKGDDQDEVLLDVGELGDVGAEPLEDGGWNEGGAC